MQWREQYTPFGEELQSISANDNQAGYTGHIRDAATGLNYMQARYYDPVIGRFYSNDPTGMCSTDADGNAVSGICPVPGDSKAEEIIHQQLSLEELKVL
nr:RHS repeat-associated core domain-containing protein [Aliidiomarina haloalkalitolerans]